MKIPEKDMGFYVGSFQRGERQGFNYFFNELYPALNYFAFRFLHDYRAAAEVTDTAFIQLWYQRKNFYQYHDIKFWLYTYVRNDCINRMNRLPNQSRNALQQKDPCLILPANDSILAEVMAEIHAAIEGLPDNYRIIFEMLCIQGKTIDAVATELNLTVDTVRVHKAKGVRLLQKKFEII